MAIPIVTGLPHGLEPVMTDTFLGAIKSLPEPAPVPSRRIVDRMRALLLALISGAPRRADLG